MVAVEYDVMGLPTHQDVRRPASPSDDLPVDGRNQIPEPTPPPAEEDEMTLVEVPQWVEDSPEATHQAEEQAAIPDADVAAPPPPTHATAASTIPAAANPPSPAIPYLDHEAVEAPASHTDEERPLPAVAPSVAPEAGPAPEVPDDDIPASAPDPETPITSGAGALEYDLDQGSSGILRLKPTASQWDDLPTLIATARSLGAEKDGCFKVVLPPDLLGPMPAKPAQRVPANAYRTHLIDRTRIWQVSTVPTEGNFPATSEDEGSLPRPFGGHVNEALAKLRTLFTKNKHRQMRDVRYRVDVPAWTAAQRLAAGVPEKSPMHPLKGDRLDHTKAVIPGIHTPYVYESGPAFGATFQIHAEDFRLSSLNHLYKGRKIWIVIPSSAVDLAEEKLGRRGGCSQFMRHRAEFVFPATLERLGMPYRIVDQRPGETIFVLPDAYHEGFSTGYTLAEAKNYAESTWSPASYQPCDKSCKLNTAIPAALMELIPEGAARLDLCAQHDAESFYAAESQKRKRDDEAGLRDDDAGTLENEAQRPRLTVEIAATPV